MKRAPLLIAMFFVSLGILDVYADEKKEAVVYKNLQCGCCNAYIEYLRAQGFDVTVKPMDNMSEIKSRYGVPQDYRSCHTTLLDGYVVEGHVPVGVLDRLLSERPDIKGVMLPGMPQGAPGMPGSAPEPLTIYELSGDTPRVYAVD